MSNRVLCGAILDSMSRMDATRSSESNPFQRRRNHARMVRIYRAIGVSLAALAVVLSTAAFLSN